MWCWEEPRVRKYSPVAQMNSCDLWPGCQLIMLFCPCGQALYLVVLDLDTRWPTKDLISICFVLSWIWMLVITITDTPPHYIFLGEQWGLSVADQSWYSNIGYFKAKYITLSLTWNLLGTVQIKRDFTVLTHDSLRTAILDHGNTVSLPWHRCFQSQL